MDLLNELPSRSEIEAEKTRRARNRISSFYPDTGPLRRELYPKHLAYFTAGAEHRERAFISANRIGKTEGVGGHEVSCHMTGNYSDWWVGRRFEKAVKVWACGDTSKTVRDILQEKMLGPINRLGTGMIPGDLLGNTVKKAGVADAIELAYVRHASGGMSVMTFKSYDQRREGFQGSDLDIIWLDEEPPMDIYAECLLRTMTTDGIVMLTFTPLQGLSELVLAFLPGGKLDAS